MTDSFDIKTKAPYPAGALSNFAPHSFTFDGIHCASMEGCLQSLKIQDVREQERVCCLVGRWPRAWDASTTGASRALPKIMVVSDDDGPKNGWLGQFTQLAVAEATDKRSGSEGVLARLSELMFFEAVRRHLDSMPNEQTGWLAGLRDRFVVRSLTLLHGKPAHSWTVEELAREVGLSRSSFAERFMHLVVQLSASVDVSIALAREVVALRWREKRDVHIRQPGSAIVEQAWSLHSFCYSERHPTDERICLRYKGFRNTGNETLVIRDMKSISPSRVGLRTLQRPSFA